MAAVVVVVGAVLAWRYFAVRESTDDAQIDGHIAPIAARVGGTVVAVNVDDNQEVKAGTVLVRLDDTDYKLALQRAEADLAEAQAVLRAAREGVPITTTTTASGVSSAAAGVTRAEAGVAGSQARLDAAGAHLREATANDTRLQRDLGRLRQLVEKDEISRQQYDAAVAAAASARAGVDAARATVVEAEHARAQAQDALLQAQAELRTAHTAPNQVAVMRAREASAEARVQQAQAAVLQARLALSYTTATAPTDGVISRKTVELGQTVEAGQPLLALVPLADVWVTANFKETQLRHMHPGQRAVIEVDTYGRSYRGRVDSIAAATGARFSLLPPENATGNYVKVVQRVPVKIVLDCRPGPQAPAAPRDVGRPHRVHEVADGGRSPRRRPGGEPVADHAGGDGRDVHGGARHHRGERLAAPHRRQPLRQHRGVDLGAHLVPRGQRHRAADHGLARQLLRAAAPAARRRDQLHDRVVLVRPGADAADPDLLPHHPGRHRRRHAAALAGDHARGVPAARARPGDGGVGDGDRRRADLRAGARRLADRQLQLAVDLLHQHADRRALGGDDPGVHPRPAYIKRELGEDRRLGDRAARGGDRRAADRPRQGAGGGLVRIGSGSPRCSWWRSSA